MIDAIEADEAWWPPTLTPEGALRTRLAWWTIEVASHRTRSCTASSVASSVDRSSALSIRLSLDSPINASTCQPHPARGPRRLRARGAPPLSAIERARRRDAGLRSLRRSRLPGAARTLAGRADQLPVLPPPRAGAGVPLARPARPAGVRGGPGGGALSAGAPLLQETELVPAAVPA